jgi:hypothetical protein
MHKLCCNRSEKIYTCIYFGIAYLCILPLVIFDNLVNHLKFNNMIFKHFLMTSYFIQVKDTLRDY